MFRFILNSLTLALWIISLPLVSCLRSLGAPESEAVREQKENEGKCEVRM